MLFRLVEINFLLQVTKRLCSCRDRNFNDYVIFASAPEDMSRTIMLTQFVKHLFAVRLRSDKNRRFAAESRVTSQNSPQLLVSKKCDLADSKGSDLTSIE